MRYVALLRAVNVGGTGVIPMEEVRGLFAELGYEDVSRYVAFLDAPVGKAAPPRMPDADVEFPAPRESEVYVVATKTTTRGVDPPKFLEKTLGTKATARAWTVVQSLAALANE